MSILFHPDGRQEVVHPQGKVWEAAELQRLVGGYIEVVQTWASPAVLVINDEGKLRGLELNMEATDLMAREYVAAGDYIVGPAVLCKQSGEELV